MHCAELAPRWRQQAGPGDLAVSTSLVIIPGNMGQSLETVTDVPKNHSQTKLLQQCFCSSLQAPPSQPHCHSITPTGCMAPAGPHPATTLKQLTCMHCSLNFEPTPEFCRGRLLEARIAPVVDFYCCYKAKLIRRCRSGQAGKLQGLERDGSWLGMLGCLAEFWSGITGNGGRVCVQGVTGDAGVPGMSGAERFGSLRTSSWLFLQRCSSSCSVKHHLYDRHYGGTVP